VFLGNRKIRRTKRGKKEKVEGLSEDSEVVREEK
jgi:hypothetical protein